MTLLLPATAAATDLLQTYELARQGDAQLSEAEYQRLLDAGSDQDSDTEADDE